MTLQTLNKMGGQMRQWWARIYSASKAMPVVGHRTTVQPHHVRYMSDSSAIRLHGQHHSVSNIQQGLYFLRCLQTFRISPPPLLTTPYQLTAAREFTPPAHSSQHQTKTPNKPCRYDRHRGGGTCRLPVAQPPCTQKSPKQAQAPTPNKTPHRVNHRWGVVHGGVSRQMRLKTSEPLVPPKPKLFFRATSIFKSRAVLAQ